MRGQEKEIQNEGMIPLLMGEADANILPGQSSIYPMNDALQEFNYPESLQDIMKRRSELKVGDRA